jgi:hypothetical protein
LDTTPLPLADAPASNVQGPREPRRLPAGSGASFWGEAWRIFNAAPVPWILMLIVYVLISLCLEIIPVIGGLAHIVLTPVLIGGMMLGCHALARGETLSVTHLFAGFRDGRVGPLAILGLMMLALLIVFGIFLFFGMLMTFGMSGLSALAGQGDPWAMPGVLGAGLFALLAIALIGGALIAMAYWFAPALVVLNGEEPMNALKKSFAASWTNMGAFLIYGLIFIGLAILASIPLGLGWLVLAPMIAGSCYASWRQIFSA